MNDLELARSLLNDGEVRPALEVLSNYLTGTVRSNYSKSSAERIDTVTILLSQLSRNNRDYMKGVISIGDRTIVDNQIISRALMLITSLDDLAISSQPQPRQLPDESVREKITSSQIHLRQTGWIAKGLSVAACVCRLSSNKKLGTGFLINNNIVITNNHVIGTAGESHNFAAEFFYETDDKGSECEIRSLSFDPNRTFITSSELDLTAIALVDNPGGDIYRAETKHNLFPSIGDHVNIIQHPSGGYKQMAITNNVVVNVYGNFMQYMTDTLPGSSGSPVFDDNWRLIAIHHAGGNLIKNSKGEKLFANEGIMLCKAKEDPLFQAVLS